MKLITPYNTQNNQNCSRPVTSKGKLTDYAKILLQVKKSDRGYSKIQLLEIVVPDIARMVNSGSFTRATYCQSFASMSVNGLLEYDQTNRKWYAGHNFNEYMRTYLRGY